MYSKMPYMIPVNPHVTSEPEKKIVVGKEVTSTAAVEDRARSEFNEAIQDGTPHVPIGIKQLNKKNLPVRTQQPRGDHLLINGRKRKLL